MFPVLPNKTHWWATGTREPLTFGLFVWCQTSWLTHEEVKNGHIHDVQQPSPTVVRWSLFDLLTVVWIHLPPEQYQHQSALMHLKPQWVQNARSEDAGWCLTLPSCACGRSVSRGSSRSCAWPRPDPAGRPPGILLTGRVCRRGRAQWNSSTSTLHRNTRCWLRMGRKAHCGYSVRSFIITDKRKKANYTHISYNTPKLLKNHFHKIPVTWGNSLSCIKLLRLTATAINTPMFNRLKTFQVYNIWHIFLLGFNLKKNLLKTAPSFLLLFFWASISWLVSDF